MTDVQVRILQLGQRVISHQTVGGATLGRVLDEVGLLPPPVGVDVRVNSQAATPDRVLADGDVVTLIPRIKGGCGADGGAHHSHISKKEIVGLEIAASNPNLSPATRFGDLLFVAGQTGRHPLTGAVGKDIREQTRNVLERIKLILESAGSSLDNVLTATTYLTSVDNLPAYNEEYASYFPNNKPARTTVTVASLNAPELLIEITVIACITGNTKT